MVNTLLVDFSRVVLIPKDPTYTGSLNTLYRSLSLEERKNDFLQYFSWNESMISFLESIKGRFQLILFTTDIIHTDPAVLARLGDLFQQIFTSSDNGFPKDAAASYIFVADQLKKHPREILFIDDKPKNIAAAREAGMAVVQYVTHEQFLLDVAKHFS